MKAISSIASNATRIVNFFVIPSSVNKRVFPARKLDLFYTICSAVGISKTPGEPKRQNQANFSAFTRTSSVSAKCS